MKKALRGAESPAAGRTVADILDAEAQAREAVRLCHQRHDQIIDQAKEQAARIRVRAEARMRHIQASQDNQKTGVPVAAQAGKQPEANADTGQDLAQLQAVVECLAARLTGETA